MKGKLPCSPSHTQPQPTWRDRFTERELRLIKNARTYAEVPWDGDDPAGPPNHDLLLIIARLSEALDTLPLHEVSPGVEELLRDFSEQKRLEGKLTEIWTDEDVQAVVAVLSPYLGDR